MAMNVSPMGNTFNGYIAEFPGLRVDCFDDKACPRTKATDESVVFYLLTHAHTDHLNGLNSPKFSGKPVYCSPTTKAILAADSSYDTNLGSIHSLSLNTRHTFTLQQKHITITLIPANHCAGAAMFLIESEDKTVLLTGDIRAERSWVDQLPRNPLLFPYTTTSKQITTIYLDTTYQYRPTPYIHILQNYEGLQMLSSLMGNYPTHLDQVHFLFPQETLGFEEVWAQVLSLVGNDIKMTASPKILERTRRVAAGTAGIDQWYAELVQERMSLNDDGATFHIARALPDTTKKEVFTVTVRAVIDLSYEDLMAQTMPLKLTGKKVPKEFVFMFGIKGGAVYEHRGTKKRYLHLTDSDVLLGDEILYYFSRHSSYSECYNFLSMFNVADVYPIVENKESWFKRGFSIQRHFGPLLNNKTYRYDRESMKFYGDQGSIRFDPPPTTQKKQTPRTKDFTQSMREYESSHNLSNLIRGQQRIGNAFGSSDDIDQCIAELRHNDLAIMGRKLTGNNQFRIEKKVLNGEDWTRTKKQDLVNDDDADYEYSEDEDNEDAIRFNALAKRAAEEEQRVLKMTQEKGQIQAGQQCNKKVKLERLSLVVEEHVSEVIEDSQGEEEIVTSKDTISLRTETECDKEEEEEAGALTEDDTLESTDATREVSIVMEFPRPQPRDSYKLDLDHSRIKMIEKYMICDVGEGFFGCDLESCKGQG